MDKIINLKFFSVCLVFSLLFLGCSKKPISEKQKAINAYKEKQKRLNIIDSQPEGIQIDDKKENEKITEKDSIIFYIKCMNYILQEEFEKAKDEIKTGLNIYQAKEDFRGSLENLLDLLELMENKLIRKETVFSYCRGKIFYLDGKYQQAIDEFKKIIEYVNNFSLAYTNLGMIYLDLSQYQEALNYFEKGVKAEPELSINYLGASTANYYLEQYQQAIDYALKGIQLDPYQVETYIRLGSNYNAFGEYEKAVNSFQKAIKLDPDSIKAYIGLGSAYSILGNYQQASSCFLNAIKIKDDNAEAYYGLGLVYHRLGQYKKARKNLQKAKELYGKESDYQHIRKVEKWLDRIPD